MGALSIAGFGLQKAASCSRDIRDRDFCPTFPLAKLFGNTINWPVNSGVSVIRLSATMFIISIVDLIRFIPF